MLKAVWFEYSIWFIQLGMEIFCFLFKAGFLISPVTDPKIKDWIVKGWVEFHENWRNFSTLAECIFNDQGSSRALARETHSSMTSHRMWLLLWLLALTTLLSVPVIRLIKYILIKWKRHTSFSVLYSLPVKSSNSAASLTLQCLSLSE